MDDRQEYVQRTAGGEINRRCLMPHSATRMTTAGYFRRSPQMERGSVTPTKSWSKLACLVHDCGAGTPGPANISSPTDSWEESNHAF